MWYGCHVLYNQTACTAYVGDFQECCKPMVQPSNHPKTGCNWKNEESWSGRYPGSVAATVMMIIL